MDAFFCTCFPSLQTCAIYLRFYSPVNTLLGAAGEGIGFDKKLKVNTVKTRTHSLLNQGIFYYKCFNGFKVDEQEKILTAFNELLAEQPIWMGLFLSI